MELSAEAFEVELPWASGSVHSHEVPEHPCPACDTLLSHATAGEQRPEPGDFTICFTCAAPLKFTEDLQVVVLAGEDFAALPPGVQDDLNHVRSSILRFQARREDGRAAP